MASPLDPIAKLPLWQAGLIGVLIAALVGAGGYMLYYEEAVQARDNAQQGLTKAEGDRSAMETKLANYEEEMRQQEELSRQVEQDAMKLPRSKDVVSHLMKTFQMNTRLVGVDIQSWAPGPEEQLDYYAKAPVEIHATGTWHQIGEFFRKISEMTQIVNIERVRLQSSGKDPVGGHEVLRVDFTATAFRSTYTPPPPSAPAEPAAGGEGAG